MSSFEKVSGMSVFCSIILTAYNVENYIEDSILSVVNSNSTDWELIIVDDGSTDGTPNIINQFLSNKKIFTYTTVNRGLGAARNFGIHKSKGEYILFLDGDDMIRNDLITNLFETVQINKKDVICFGWQSYKSKSIVEADFFTRYMTVAVWNKCYRKAWLSENEIEFMETVLFEDVAYSLDLMMNAPQFVNKDFEGYVYRIRRESISHSSYSVDKENDAIKILNRMCNEVSISSEKLIKQYVAEFWWRHLIYSLNMERDNSDFSSLRNMIRILNESSVSRKHVLKGRMLHDFVVMTIPVLINLNFVRIARIVNHSADWLAFRVNNLIINLSK